MAVAAAGDLKTPERACRTLYDQMGSEARKFITLGHAHGFSSDFGHAEMLVSDAAQAEVWPLVLEWLHGHTALQLSGTGKQSDDTPLGFRQVEVEATM